jgi:signal transduction histidine kinase
LVYDKPALTLRVTDDGLGFEPELVSHGSARHFGLTAMRERAEQIAARFTVATTPGQGTMIEAALTQVAVSELSQDPR